MYSHGSVYGNDNDPVKIVWKGEILFNIGGVYKFQPVRHILGKWNLKLDGERFPENKFRVTKDLKGWHEFEITYESNKRAEVFWFGWTTPRGDTELVPSDKLRGITPKGEMGS